VSRETYSELAEKLAPFLIGALFDTSGTGGASNLAFLDQGNAFIAANQTIVATDTSTTPQPGIGIATTYNPGGAPLNGVAGHTVTTIIDPSNSQAWGAFQVKGVQSIVDNQGSGTAGTLIALDGDARQTGSGTAPAVYGVRGFVRADTGGITDARALFAGTPVRTTGGAIATAYGVYVAPQQVSGVTTGYGLYQAGTSDQNYLAGATTFAAGVTVAPTQTTGNVLAAVPTITDPTGGNVGVLGQVAATLTADNANTIKGLVGDARANPGGHTLSNAAAGLVGVQGLARLTAAGTVTAAAAFLAQLITATGTITTGYGVEVLSPSTPSGAITTAYGLYLNDQKASGVTTAYGVRQVGSTNLNQFDGSLGVGISPVAPLHAIVSDSATTSRSTVAILGHSTSGTAGVSFGSQLTFQLDSSTVINRDAAYLTVDWNNATDVTRSSILSFWTAKNGTLGQNMVLDQNGNVGIGTTGPASRLHVLGSTGSTSSSGLQVMTIGATSTGTPAAGFGGNIPFTAKSDTTSGRQVAEIDWLWATVTDAIRKGRLVLSVNDATGTHEGLRLEGSGTAAMLGFFGTTAVARPSTYTLSGAVTRTMPTDPSSAYTGIASGVAGTPYAQLTDLNTLRTAVSSLVGVVRQILTDLGSTSGYGLLAA
jgi:hypothetical protein